MGDLDTNTAATVILRLPSNAVHVRTARLVAAAMARRSGVEETLLDEVRLAVGEACARAVRLHERFGLTAPVTVEFDERERFVVSVLDQAPVTGMTDTQRAIRAAGPSAGSASVSEDGSRAAASLDGTGSGTTPRSPNSAAGFSAPWADPTGDSLGLALLAAVVQDLAVDPEPEGPGSRVVMTWPVH